MRVGVFSDTHGSLTNLNLALSKLGKLDAIFHLGDYGADAGVIGTKLDIPYYAVRGNCDFHPTEPREQVVELEGCRILLTHGDRYRDLYALTRRAEEEACDMVLFGHTHIPLFTAEGKILILNPGSLSRPRGGSACSCALLTLDDGTIRAELIPVC